MFRRHCIFGVSSCSTEVHASGVTARGGGARVPKNLPETLIRRQLSYSPTTLEISWLCYSTNLSPINR